MCTKLRIDLDQGNTCKKKQETKTSKILIKGDGLAAVAGMLKFSCKLVSIRCWRTCTQLLVVHSS